MEEILQNIWVVTIVGGLFVTIIGGLILYYILKKKKEDRLNFKLENDGELEVENDLTVGDKKNSISQFNREHKATIKKNGKIIVKGDFTIGNKTTE